MSMTNQAIERLKGLVKKWRVEAMACCREGTEYRHGEETGLIRCADDIESLLGEPSDELPLVDGRQCMISEQLSGHCLIYEAGPDQPQYPRPHLDRSGRWRQGWPIEAEDWHESRAAAVAFLRECAAQAASEPQERITADVASTEERDRVAADCMVRHVPQTMIGWAIEQLEKRRPAPAPQAEPTTEAR